MRSANEVKDALSSLFARPEMWAASTEAYEAQFNTLLWFLGLERPHALLAAWWCKKDSTNRRGNVPVWAQVRTLTQLSAILRQFYDEEVEPPKRCRMCDCDTPEGDRCSCECHP